LLVCWAYTFPWLAVDLKLVTARAAPARPAGDARRYTDLKYLEDIERSGFAIKREAVADGALVSVERAIAANHSSSASRERNGSLFGMRNLLEVIPEVRELASSSALQRFVVPVLGGSAAAVRGLYFDKTRAANWKLGWHQDKAIAVRGRVDVEGYGPWSVKAGVHHVFPPKGILRQMLTVRVHLDACDGATGALKVIPGSHDRVLESDSEFSSMADARGVVSCDVERGDVVIMRPLIGHASDKCARPSHRRIVHIEYAARELPKPLAWNEYVPFAAAV
jgi:hypothetical protein